MPETVLLIHVPVGFEESYPLALAAVAAPLLAAGVPVKGVDAARVGMAGIRARLTADVAVVGLSAWSAGVEAVRQVVGLIRRTLPKALVVLGGPHPTLLPWDIDADIVVRGEGEETFPEVVAAHTRGGSPVGIPGTWARSGTGSPRPPADLAQLAFPDRTLFRVADYHRDHNPRGPRYTSVVTSRGCLHDCAYCSSPALWGRGHRFRPHEQVAAEWRQLRRDHGVSTVLVEDDLFTQRPARVEGLCEQLLREDSPGVGWELINGVRPETVHARLLALMARAGCRRIAFSIESGDVQRLRDLGRGTNGDRVRSAVRGARAAGIGVTGYFLVGLPGESSAERRRLFEYAAGLDLDMAHFSIASDWPGTRFQGTLANVSPAERAALYGRWYFHPRRAVRAARVLGARPRDLPRLAGRLLDWMARPLESRRPRLDRVPEAEASA